MLDIYIIQWRHSKQGHSFDTWVADPVGFRQNKAFDRYLLFMTNIESKRLPTNILPQRIRTELQNTYSTGINGKAFEIQDAAKCPGLLHL